MFTQISLSNYILVMLLLTTVYYAFIAYRFFRKDIVKLFAGGKISSEEISNDFQNSMFYSFSMELRAFLFEAIKNNLSKADIMDTIQMLIRNYSGVKDITFRNSTEHLIIEECAASIHLSEQDLCELWN